LSFASYHIGCGTNTIAMSLTVEPDPISLDLTTKLDLIASGTTAEPNPIAFVCGPARPIILGLALRPDPMLLGVARPPDPMILGLALQVDRKLLLTRCGARTNILVIILLCNNYFLKYFFKNIY